MEEAESVDEGVVVANFIFRLHSIKVGDTDEVLFNSSSISNSDCPREREVIGTPGVEFGFEFSIVDSIFALVIRITKYFRVVLSTAAKWVTVTVGCGEEMASFISDDDVIVVKSNVRVENVFSSVSVDFSLERGGTSRGDVAVIFFFNPALERSTT